MLARVITIIGHPYSERCADRCIASAAEHGVTVEKFPATTPDEALDLLKREGLRWTWANDNRSAAVCRASGLRQHPYPGQLETRVACALSHYRLWRDCSEPMLVLEHDAVFIGELPDIEWESICMVNDPTGATPRGAWWAEKMRVRGPGVFPKTRVFDDPLRPDGLAGNSAYLIKPSAALQMCRIFRDYGVWPNDASMCWQLMPGLQELYPFVTRVEQTQSTTSSLC